MKALLRPVGIAVLISMFLSTMLFFVATWRAGGISHGGQYVLELGPVQFVTLVRHLTAEGSTVSVTPGLGFFVLVAAMVAYALSVGVRQQRAARLATRLATR